jgi:hypothetical protein
VYQYQSIGDATASTASESQVVCNSYSTLHQCAGLVFRESADTEVALDPYLGGAVECVEVAQSGSPEWSL